MIKDMHQFIKFGIIGGLNTILTFIIYWILIHATNATIAMAIGYGTTSLIGLLVNKYWVFNTNEHIKNVAWKYYATYGFTWLLSVIFANIASTIWKFPSWIIPLGSLLLTIPLNFLLSKLWVFSSPKHTKEVKYDDR